MFASAPVALAAPNGATPGTAVDVTVAAIAPVDTDQLTLVPSPGSQAPTPNYSVGIGRGLYVYLNQSDQRLVAAGTLMVLGPAICGASVGFGCAALYFGLGVAAQWINDRGGICTGTKTRLELWFPVWGSSAMIPKCVK